MPFLTPLQFRNVTLGSSLQGKVWQGPQGDALLYNYLEVALVMMEDYIQAPLRFHPVYDEEGTILDRNLTVFPLQAPIRAPLRYSVLMAAQGAARTQWDMPCRVIETTNLFPGQNPLLYGNVKVNRVENMFQVTSYAGALGFPWASIYSFGADVLMSYTAGYDDPFGTNMLTYGPVIAGDVAPTTTSFCLPPGMGAFVFINGQIVVGAQSGMVKSINNLAHSDQVLLQAALPQAPAIGDIVQQPDGVTLPAPQWLVELERQTARYLINLHNATGGGAASMGQVKMGAISWTLPAGTEPQLPQNVKNSLDKHFVETAAELA